MFLYITDAAICLLVSPDTGQHLQISMPPGSPPLPFMIGFPGQNSRQSEQPIYVFVQFPCLVRSAADKWISSRTLTQRGAVELSDAGNDMNQYS